MSDRTRMGAVVGTGGEGPPGSAIMLALFACLVAVTTVLVLSGIVVSGERALVDEVEGRETLRARDACLVALREKALVEWRASTWTPVEVPWGELSGRLAQTGEGQEWVLRAEVEQVPRTASGLTSVLVERGRDGMELPWAGLVAGKVVVAPGRATPWLERESGAMAEEDESDKVTIACVGRVDGDTAIGEGCMVKSLRSAWALDEGWRAALVEGHLSGMGLAVVEGEEGSFAAAPEIAQQSGPFRPTFIVATGGVSLDLRHMGEVWGVVVADGASVLLEGTVIHGAVYVTDRVEVGTRGGVVFSEAVYRWARDHSLVRTRLVPGSRREGIQ